MNLFLQKGCMSKASRRESQREEVTGKQFNKTIFFIHIRGKFI